MLTTHDSVSQAPRRTILLDLAVYEKAANIAQSHDMPLRKFVNEYLVNAFRREELVNRFRPSFRIVHTEGNSVFIKDDTTNKVIEVVLLTEQNDKVSIECIEDKSSDCVHVSYTLMSNEVGRLKLSITY
jgi:hypothetical protein